MNETIETALLYLIYASLTLVIALTVYVFARLFSNPTQTIKLEGESAVKLKGTTDSSDNIYTELAAGKHTKAAELNLKAQEVALKVAESQEKAELTRLERVKLEQSGSK